MVSELPRDHEQNYEPVLDREKIIENMQVLGIEIDLEEFDDQDDNDVLGTLAIYAAMYDFDIDDILYNVAPVEDRFDKEDDDEV